METRISYAIRNALKELAGDTRYYIRMAGRGAEVEGHKWGGGTRMINGRTLRKMYEYGMIKTLDIGPVELAEEGKRYAIGYGYMKSPRREED